MPTDCWSHIPVVNDHPSSIDVWSARRIRQPLLVFYTGLVLQIHSYPDSSRCYKLQEFIIKLRIYESMGWR